MSASQPAENRPPLPRRQRQLLLLLAHGANTKEAAATMGISLVMTQRHVSALMRRYNCQTRATLLLQAARSGDLERDDD
jgi:DNA-binding NarL/FixJ family response regulator